MFPNKLLLRFLLHCFLSTPNLFYIELNIYDILIIPNDPFRVDEVNVVANVEFVCGVVEKFFASAVLMLNKCVVGAFDLDDCFAVVVFVDSKALVEPVVNVDEAFAGAVVVNKGIVVDDCVVGGNEVEDVVAVKFVMVIVFVDSVAEPVVFVDDAVA